MEAVKNLLKPKPTPQQQLREWQRRLRNEGRNIERQIRDVQKEEKKVEKEIREAAKRGDIGTAKALAKELVLSRKAVNRLYENKAQLNSISMHLGEIVATTRTVGHLSKSAQVMKLVNNLMKAPEVAATMQEFSKEMTKAGVMEEMVNDAMDSALDSEDMEKRGKRGGAGETSDGERFGRKKRGHEHACDLQFLYTSAPPFILGGPLQVLLKVHVVGPGITSGAMQYGPASSQSFSYLFVQVWFL